MTKNEYIASIMLEAADLLRNGDVLNEGVSYTNDLASHIKNSMDFTESEKDKAIDWLNKNNKKIAELATMAKDDYKTMRKADIITCVAFIVTIPTVILPLLISIVYLIVFGICSNKMNNTRTSISAIKRKLLQIDKSKLNKEQLIQYEKTIEKINEYEDEAYDKVKFEDK